jgi:hypothetical protein
MTHWSEQDLLELQLRRQITQESIDRPSPDHFTDTAADDEPESKLASTIRDWVKRKGYKAIINPQNKKLSWFIEAGMPDVVLFLPFSQVACFELKSKTGRLSDDQKLTKQILSWLGHTIYEVRSYKSFLEVVEKVTRRE